MFAFSNMIAKYRTRVMAYRQGVHHWKIINDIWNMDTIFHIIHISNYISNICNILAYSIFRLDLYSEYSHVFLYIPSYIHCCFHFRSSVFHPVGRFHSAKSDITLHVWQTHSEKWAIAYPSHNPMQEHAGARDFRSQSSGVQIISTTGSLAYWMAKSDIWFWGRGMWSCGIQQVSKYIKFVWCAT